MTKQQKINFLIENFKSKQNRKSKWYASDVADFVLGVSGESEERIDMMYSNAVAFNSKSFDDMVAKEEKKMDKFGLYDIGKMAPKNALD